MYKNVYMYKFMYSMYTCVLYTYVFVNQAINQKCTNVAGKNTPT